MGHAYTDLLVWQEAMNLAESIYLATQRFPADERYGMVSQLRRAAVSVPSNIAEGQARRTRGEFLHFLGQARGSLAEIGTHVTLALRVRILSNDEANCRQKQIATVGRLLNALMSSLTPTAKARSTNNQQPTTGNS